ncbi:MAG: YajG family lipoprotein [Saccharospirillaceae bacterium]|nr:YajG family lipoprotein [Saccharospirillaceae bacterium]MCD8531410.1 YajG family lipoprotein [Saccharospirillaceae bacterium]
MRKLVIASLLTGTMAACLSGCVLAPQTIALNESVSVPGGMPAIQRDALVRVVDEREQGADVLGHRGGRAPENSPLLSDKPLTDVLTARMQDSLKSLGFGAASPIDPVRVQLTVEEFSYRCNEGAIVNECGMTMRFKITVMDNGKTFTKPYSASATRSLAASPATEYNQKWVNEVLDSVWERMFSDAELRQALNIR